MTLVALSASYGAGGSRVGPALAERLGVPFLDRAIPLEVAERLHVAVGAADAHDDRVSMSFWERLLSGFAAGDSGAPTAVPDEGMNSDDFRRTTEKVLLNQAATGEGVILGRAAVLVLRDDPRVLRVRLDGPADRRVDQVVALEGIDRETAQRALRETDRAHAEYVRRFYGARLDDPSLYHLVLDSTAIDLGTCVEAIAVIAAARPDPGPREWRARR
jgi:cytidylate kinase